MPAAPLAVEHAEAVLSCGRLAESRPLFQHAARLAEHEGDATALARAALGLGGLWISEHRLESEAASMLALQHRALDALPAGDRVLRARLTARLAAESDQGSSTMRRSNVACFKTVAAEPTSGTTSISLQRQIISQGPVPYLRSWGPITGARPVRLWAVDRIGDHHISFLRPGTARRNVSGRITTR